jgi:hypothetical protein
MVRMGVTQLTWNELEVENTRNTSVERKYESHVGKLIGW